MDRPARLVMPEASRYRTAIRSDLPQIVEIYNSTIPSRIATADTEPVSVESRVHWFEEHTPDRRPLWVVEDAGRVAAWLSFSNFYGRPAYAKTTEVSVYVHEAFRKRGFGSYLLNPGAGSRADVRGRHAVGVHIRPQRTEPCLVPAIRIPAMG